MSAHLQELPPDDTGESFDLPPDPPATNVRERLKRRLMQAREVIEFAVRTARRLQLAQVAGSLTFSTVLALVPLLAVVLAVLTAFPMFTQFRETLERDLPKGLLPDPYAQTILRYLADFASKAAGVGAAGLLFLVLSALTMILTVDKTLNDIWQVRRRRPLVQRLLIYWAGLTVAPLLLGLSLSLTSFVMSVSNTSIGSFGTGLRHVVSLIAPAIATAAYSAAYVLVPNRPVSWRHAVIGGTVTAITGEFMSRGFAAYVIHGSVLSIYGAFAILPIFLLWIFLSWLTFLFGAAIAATLPQLRSTRFADVHRAGNDAVTVMALVKILYDARDGGALRALPVRALARALRTDEESLRGFLVGLESLGYVRKLAPPESRAETRSEEWILSCDPQTQGLGPAFHAFALDPNNSLLHRNDLGLAAWLAPVLQGAWLQRGLAKIGRVEAC
jgi:membrane protein